MSRERTRHALVLLVVLLGVSAVAAPALAAPTDTTSDTGIDDTLSDDGTTTDGSTDDSTTNGSTSDDGSTSKDGTNSSDDSTDGSSDDDGSSSRDTSSTNDSDSASENWQSPDSGANSSSQGNETAAPINLTESVNETFAAADETLTVAERRILARAPSGLSVDSLSELGSNGTNATSAVTSSADDGRRVLDSTTDSADGLLESTVATVMESVSGGDDGARAAGGTGQAQGAADGSGPAFLAANVPGGGDGDGTPPGPTAGLALGVGAVAAAAVTRQGAIFPGLTAEVGATAMSALAVPGRVRSGLDRLLRTVAPFRYSRYDDSDPLEHEARAEVFSVVEESPGAYLSELAERADVPLSTARHHVRVLEREDIVSGAKVRGKRRFYPAYATDVEISAAMNDDATAAVIDALARLGPSSVSALADEVGRDPSTVTHHLQRLEEDDIVVREREGRSVVNKLSPEARTALEPETGEAEPAEAPEALASD